MDATVKKVISSKNAQGCPKNWDIYKKLGMNSEEKPPIEKIQKDCENPPVAGKLVVPGLEERTIRKAVKSIDGIEKNPLPPPAAGKKRVSHAWKDRDI